jgi:hypothetical protein
MAIKHVLIIHMSTILKDSLRTKSLPYFYYTVFITWYLYLSFNLWKYYIQGDVFMKVFGSIFFIAIILPLFKIGKNIYLAFKTDKMPSI